MNPIRSLKNSFFELKKLQSMVIIAMLLALRVVLGMFANATLPIFGNAVKISGAFLPIAMAGAMFGPVPGMLVGALGDVLSYIIAPTAGGFFPGLTLSGALTGLIYGFFLPCRVLLSHGQSTRWWSKPSSPPIGCFCSTAPAAAKPMIYGCCRGSSVRRSSVCPKL